MAADEESNGVGPAGQDAAQSIEGGASDDMTPDCFAALSGQLKELQSLLRVRLEELDRKEVEYAERLRGVATQEEELDAQKAALHEVADRSQGRVDELEQRCAELTARVGELEGQQGQIDEQLCGVAAERVRLDQAETALKIREEAISKFEAALACVVQIFSGDSPGEPPPAAQPPDPPEQPFAEAMPVEPPAVSGDEDAPDPDITVADKHESIEAPADVGPAEPPVSPEQDAAPVAAIEETAAEPPEDETSDSTSAAGGIDETQLDPELRQKLHVMRRLTGGRVPDVELLARIEQEPTADGSDRTLGGKSKRRWWSG